jgi:hypothetical protein
MMDISFCDGAILKHEIERLRATTFYLNIVHITLLVIGIIVFLVIVCKS